MSVLAFRIFQSSKLTQTEINARVKRSEDSELNIALILPISSLIKTKKSHKRIHRHQKILRQNTFII